MSSEVPPEGNRLLIGYIRQAIERAGGRIPFRDYMELALYHPEHGYYSAPGEKTGKRGDYLTSPRISPLFGQCLARVIGSGAVLELGAGDGSLAAELAPRFDYTIVERSPDFRRRQQAHLGSAARWLDEFPEGFEGTVVSNELLDALPVHRLVRDRERYVRANFTEELAACSTPRLAEYFERLGLTPAGEAEVNLDAVELMSAVYARLAVGRVVTIDYGYEAEALFEGHPQGTFLTYYQHTTNDNPYEHIGYKDMTAHVDFTTLMALGESHGLRTTAFTTQADFLAQQGIGELLVALQSEASGAAAYAAARQAVMTLLDPQGLGGFRVLVQEKVRASGRSRPSGALPASRLAEAGRRCAHR
jgi:SAM-dependent MidA family methyltransferase